MTDLFGPLFGDAQVESQLSGRARLQAMLDVEAALADAEADLGIIPRSCVTPIRNAARASLYDARALATEKRGAVHVPPDKADFTGGRGRATSSRRHPWGKQS